MHLGLTAVWLRSGFHGPKMIKMKLNTIQQNTNQFDVKQVEQQTIYQIDMGKNHNQTKLNNNDTK